MGLNHEDFFIDCAPNRYSIPKTRRKQKKPFIKGPLPHDWISQAIAAGNSAISIGIVLWYLRGLNNKNEFRLTNVELSKWNIDRYQKYRGLKQLEEAGLIVIKRAKFKNPVVKLLKVGPLY